MKIGVWLNAFRPQTSALKTLMRSAWVQRIVPDGRVWPVSLQAIAHKLAARSDPFSYRDGEQRASRSAKA
jgi:hypothetical protein